MTARYLIAAVLCLSAFSAAAEQEATSAPVRPGAEEGQFPPSDGLAECAAILAAAGSRSKNLIERESLLLAAGSWFAISGDVAIAEGAPPEEGVWEQKVTDWAGRIGSVDALGRHGDWMGYCAHLGASNGLDPALFAARSE